MLTILLGTSAGVAVVLYAVRPRHAVASQSLVSGVSSIETVSLPSQSTSESQSYSTPIPETTAIVPAAVEAPVEVQPISVTVSTVTADAPAAETSDAPIATIDAPAVSTPLASAAPELAHATTTVRSHRAPRRSSAAPRTRGRPRVAGSGRASVRKRLDEAAP